MKNAYWIFEKRFQISGPRRAVQKLAMAAIFMLCFTGLDNALSAQTLVSLDDAVRRIAVGIEDKLEKDTKIVILDVNVSSKRLSDHIIDELAALFINSGKLVVVDRKNLNLINEEMTFQLSGEVSDESMQSIGKKLGAQSIIAGTGEDMGDYYRLRFRTLEVVSARVQSLLSENVNKADPLFGRLTQGQSFLAMKRFTFGAALGVGLGAYSLDDLKSDYSEASLTSQTAFLASIHGAYNVNSLFAIQVELNVMINHGVVINGIDDYIYTHGVETETGSVYNPSRKESEINDVFTYTSLDIPILARFNFRPVPPLLISALVGPSISLPLGDLNNESHYSNFSQINDSRDDKILNAIFGVSAGVIIGYNLGPGYITADVRFLNDFNPIAVDYKDGDGEVKLFTRRVFNVTVGYEFWF
ncbi:MAG: outer membrane beta-barrel protein [Treponema sp.]|nr:outer membrane beta-barrel protein [Treponema sp.]